MPSDDTALAGPALWHRRLAGITGKLAMSVVKRAMRRGDLYEMAATIRGVADQMEATANGYPSQTAKEEPEFPPWQEGPEETKTSVRSNLAEGAPDSRGGKRPVQRKSRKKAA